MRSLVRFVTVLLVLVVSPLAAADEVDTTRIVSLGGGVTETVYALGLGGQVVGVDSSSSYPAPATSLPQVGYHRRLNAEGVASLRPTLVLASPGSGPPSALNQLRQMGIAILEVPEAISADGARERIQFLARVLDVPERGSQLVAVLDRQLSSADRPAKAPRVLFVYARGGGALHVAGTETSAGSAIELAGGRLAVADFTGYRPLTAEAVVAAQPDVLLLTTGGLETLGGVTGALQLPGIAATPAGRNQRVVALDDLALLGFGPRLGATIRELSEALKP